MYLIFLRADLALLISSWEKIVPLCLYRILLRVWLALLIGTGDWFSQTDNLLDVLDVADEGGQM